MSQALMKTNGLTLNGSLRALKITYLTKYFASSVGRRKKKYNCVDWKSGWRTDKSKRFPLVHITANIYKHLKNLNDKLNSLGVERLS